MKNFPNAFVIILMAILFSWTLTFILPKGSYERVVDVTADQVTVVPDSYKPTDAPNLSMFDLLLAIPKGIIDRAELIVLILLLGGCFYVIDQTGALNKGLNQLVHLLKGKESLALIIITALFLTAGFTIAIQEEIIAMFPVLLLFSRSLGYSPYTIICASFGSSVVGASFSPSNPFGVIIAQKEAELALMSGSTYRLIFLGIASLTWMIYVTRHAKNNRIKKSTENLEVEALGLRSKIILFLLTFTFIIVTYGLIQWNWGFNEMSACFFALGISCGLIAKLGLNKTTEHYVNGFKEMIFAAMIIGLANSISLILNDGVIIDTIIQGLFYPLRNLPSGVSAVLMMISHSILHFPIPSYSGQAILTMPILTPLADLIGLSRQVCVLAYQYGAIMMDVIVPTNGALMAIIALGGISYNNWLKLIIKPALLMLTIGAIAIIIAVEMGYQ